MYDRPIPIKVDFVDPSISSKTIDNKSTNQTFCNCSDPGFWYDDACDCDYPTDVPLEVRDVLPLGLIYGFVFVIGILGNLTMIYSICRFKRLRTVTNVFLVSLSTSDLCLILFCVPVQFTKYLSYTWVMGAFLCSSVHYVQMFTMICSGLTLTGVSIERYYAIVHPIQTKSLSSMSRTRRIIGLIWLCSLILAIPAWHTNRLEHFITVRKRHGTWCSRQYDEPVDYFEKAFVFYQTVLLFGVPVATMTFCYACVIRVICFSSRQFTSDGCGNSVRFKQSEMAHSKGSPRFEHLNNKKLSIDEFKLPAIPEFRTNGIRKTRYPARKNTTSSARAGSDQNVKQIVRMLVAIVLLFIICWLPYLVDEALVAFKVLNSLSQTEFLRYMRMIVAIMAYSNSCVNPIVYAFMSQHFRSAFFSLCSTGCVGGDRRRRSNGVAGVAAGVIAAPAASVSDNRNRRVSIQPRRLDVRKSSAFDDERQRAADWSLGRRSCSNPVQLQQEPLVG